MFEGTAGVAGAAAAAIAEAVKASGAIVRVKPHEFTKLVSRAEEPLVVVATGGFVRTNYQYLLSYKGFVFFTKSDQPLQLPGDAEVVRAVKIWIPG